MKIPVLYETENILVEDKVIYMKYEIERIGFFWLIAELDEKQGLAFGYANLNDPMCAEWGYIDLGDLKANGAEEVENWIPKKFSECMKAEKEERKAELWLRSLMSR